MYTVCGSISGHDIFQSGSESGSIKLDLTKMNSETRDMYRSGVFFMLICVPVICASLQLLAWSHFTLRDRRLAVVKAKRKGIMHLNIWEKSWLGCIIMLQIWWILFRLSTLDASSLYINQKAVCNIIIQGILKKKKKKELGVYAVHFYYERCLFLKTTDTNCY